MSRESKGYLLMGTAVLTVELASTALLFGSFWVIKDKSSAMINEHKTTRSEIVKAAKYCYSRKELRARGQ